MPRFDDQNPLELVPAATALSDPLSTQRFGTGEGVNEDTEFNDVRVAHDTVRLFRHGVRVANGKGFFAAPRASDNPAKNSDYFRFFVDATEGVGVISNPKTDELWFEATGDQPTDGNLIMKLLGPGSVGSSNTGIVDLYSALTLLSASGAPSSLETSGLFDVAGTMYWNTTSAAIRIYDGAAWKTITPV